MYSKKKARRLSATLLLLVATGAGAVEIGVELEAGIGQTDNITRAADTPSEPAMDDTVYQVGVDVTLEHESARSNVDLRGSLIYHDYQDGPYSSETLPALDMSALFRITDQSLSWVLDGNLGQQSVDPFQPVTPDNREDFAYFTTGPSLFIPMGARFSLRTDLTYSEIDYEEQPLDNSRKGARISFARQINPTRALSLNLRGERTEFDYDDLLASIDRYDAFLQFSTEGSRNEITVDLGWSVSERSSVESEEPLVNVEWRRQVSPATRVDIALGSRVSDSAESFRGNQQNSIDIGDVQNQQGVSDPFREDYAGLSVNYGATRTNLMVGARLSEEDYLDALIPRDRQMVRAYVNFTRQLGRAWEFALFANHSSQDYESLAREDEDLRAGVGLTWQQLRTIEIELRFDRLERDSTEPADEFTENRAYLGFRYIPDLGRQN